MSIALATTAVSGWVIPSNIGSTGTTGTALFASKSSKKAVKRAAWVESRGGAGSAVSDSPATLKNSEGLAYVELTSPNGSTTQVYTLGACVTSYKTDGVEYLKVRPDAKMDGSK
ncbi:hypothetical protein TrRE_jg750, partial [Triparma retinervis]